MWAANLQQIYVKTPDDRSFDYWVVLLAFDSDTKIEKVIRDSHKKIDTTLMEQNVLYSEITTNAGKKKVYEKFDVRSGKHPIFLLLDKYPLEYQADEKFIVIEWGKWNDIESLKDDLMALVTFFSDEEFRKRITNKQAPNRLSSIKDFIKNNCISLFNTGLKIATTLL